MSKEYGLIIPNKNKSTVVAPSRSSVKKPSIFDEDSDSSDEGAKPTGLPRFVKRQDRVLQEKAVEEDPTVYQYDEIFDEMDQKRKDSKLSRQDLDRKPKYINKLLIAADRRKRENERRIERQVQKEREAEGEEFQDKETFVTSAYKAKLEELAELEEQEKREEYLESIGDVKKQGNLDGFYRHLYDVKVNKCEQVKEIVKIEKADEAKEDKNKDEEKTVKKGSKRRYRKRESSDSENEVEAKNGVAHLNSNLDADSDFSIDSESEDEGKAKKSKEDKVEVKEEVKEVSEVVKDVSETIEPVPEVKKVIKPKIDIWKKRTVGVVFDEALQRYFERKSLRESICV